MKKDTKRGHPKKLSELLLTALESTSTLKGLVLSLDKDKRNVYKCLQRLQNKNLVFKKGRNYYLLGKRTPFRGGGTQKDTRKVLARHHNITIVVVHRESESSWNRHQGNMVKCFIPQLHRQVHIQFTKTGVQFHLEGVITKDLSGVVDLHRRVSIVVNFIERRYKIRLVRPSDVGVRKLFQELAYLGTSWAEKEIGTGRRIWLYNWKDDGKPRFLFDKSKGSEFELHGLTVDDDAIESAFFLEKLGSGEFREAYSNAEALHAYMPELSSSLKHITNSIRAISGENTTTSAGGIIDTLFQDDALRARFEASDREVQDRILGIK